MGTPNDLPRTSAKELARVIAQRDRAWRGLMKIQALVENCETGPMLLGFHLAAAHGPRDCEEWNMVFNAMEAEEE